MNSVLFVDDDKSVLEGLERSLWRLRKEWRLSFANGGEEALLTLGNEEYDVIVSDMRMPGMDGYQLLSRVRDDYPDMIRMILSGQTEHEAALRTVNVAHQFLAKPCDGNRLREILKQACRQRQLFNDASLRKLISRLGSLPSAPSVYFELTSALSRNQTSAAEIASIVQRDMGLSTKLLQVVNSAFFGLPRRFDSIQETVAYLGTDMVRSLALSVEVFRPFDGADPASVAAIEDMQKHAIACGELSRRIAGPEFADEAFLVGMMHDVGKLVIAAAMPDVFRRILSLTEAGQRPWQEVEHALIGVDHCAVGAYLLSSWGLPLLVTEAVAFHHAPHDSEQRHPELLAAVHTADTLLREADPTRHSPDNGLDMHLVESLGTKQDLPQWRQWARMGLEPDSDPEAAQ